MTVQMTERELAIEREQVEQVFRLTGGELMDEPWEGFRGASGASLQARYWYEGAPEYVASEYPEHGDYEYRTAVWPGNPFSPFPAPPEGWEQIASYVSSGETDCPCQSMDPHDAPAQCPLCEGDGIIYIGDSAEILYRTHKATLWPEDYCHAHDTPRELPCEECDASGPDCPLCGGEAYLMGRLGSREHYRCRDCGADQSLRPHDDPSLQR